MANEKSKKTVTIIVEGTEHEWPKAEISYAEVVTLEVPRMTKMPSSSTATLPGSLTVGSS